MEQKEKEIKASQNALRLCIDRYHGADMEGRIYSKITGERMNFTGTADFLLKTDGLLDVCGRPQSFQKYRSFRDGKKTDSLEKKTDNTEKKMQNILRDEAVENNQYQKGFCNTYDIVIQSRKHASWQGFVSDENDRFLGRFESEIQLMDVIAKAHANEYVITGMRK